MHIWTHKHQPKKTSEIEGQEEAVQQLRNFILTYGKSRKKAALVHGAVGSGKTSSIYAIAAELGLEIVEINASDFRDAKSIESIIGSASRQSSLFGRGKLILVDEIDGISGMEDRGGVAALARVIAESSFPVILTANNPFDSKFSILRKASVLIEFRKLMPDALARIIRRICSLEGIQSDDGLIMSLARRCGGDARALINDLQSLTADSGMLSSDDISSLSSRNQEEDMLTALNKILKSTDLSIALSGFDNLDEDVGKCFLWLDENLPKEYRLPEDLARAYDSISKADVFYGRIRRWQHWRFLVYVYAFLSGGVAIAKKRKYEGIAAYSQPSRILKIWIANNRNSKKKAIAQKIAAKAHSSTKAVIRETMPYLRIICRDDRAAERIAAEYKLEPEEADWLRER